MTDPPPEARGRNRLVRTARLPAALPATRRAVRVVRIPATARLDGVQPDPAPPPRRKRGPGPEELFARQFLKLAGTLGWAWSHFRPGRTKHGWRTPVSGPLGAGWPDYVLVRRERIVFAELKSDVGVVSSAQRHVLGVLGGLVVPGDRRIEVHTFRPADLDGAILATLR
jgi:hypothetical protein